MVEYTYDAWGNHTVSGALASTIGALNPFRYRGYFYDVETGFYYLQTRYYDPVIGRFLNRDSIDYADPETINGLNLYSYCNNNPVMNADPSGHLFFTCLLIGLIAGAVIGATLNGVNAYNNGARGWELVGAIALGAVVGGVIGAVAGAVAGAGALLINAGLGAIGAGMGGGLALASGGMLGGGAMVAIGAGAVVAGSALVAGGLLGGLYLFAKGNGPRMGHNQYENKQFRDAMNKLGIDRTDPKWWEAHDALQNEPPMKFKELLTFLKELLGF